MKVHGLDLFLVVGLCFCLSFLSSSDVGTIVSVIVLGLLVLFQIVESIVRR